MSPLPCPFCGGEAKVFKRAIHEQPTSRYLYWYVCNTHGCGAGVTYGEYSEAEALKKWNTRIREVK